MSNLQIEYRAPEALKPRPGNPRTHSRKQIRQIAASIKRFGFVNPVLIDDDGFLIAGHGRIEAAKSLDLETVPTVRLSGMTEAEIRAYVIADNRLAELAGWDDALLRTEFLYLDTLGIEIDPTVTGFELLEIDILLTDNAAGEEPDPADKPPEIDPTQPIVTQPQDLWILGDHRLFCGDATLRDSYRTLMDGETARMVFTDPPYNVPIGGHVSGLGKVQHREFVMATGEMDDAAYGDFLRAFMGGAIDSSTDGALHYICIDWRHVYDVIAAGRDLYTDLKNICVWNKSNGGMGSLYRSKHELVVVFKAGTAAHVNNVRLGVHGRNRTNVWDYPGMTSPGAERDASLALHPTVKPVALVADAILDASSRGDIVLDPFAGSGTTILAAERTGRRCFALELDRRYVDVCVQRFQQLTGEAAVNAATGRTFDESAEDLAEMLGAA